MSARRWSMTAAGVLLLGVLAGCGGSSGSPVAVRATTAPRTSAAAAEPAEPAPTAAAKPAALRNGETRQVLKLRAPYTPKPPYGVGTDDYHCFLLDPKLARDTFVTGYDIRPDNLEVVHHVILFRVPPAQVAEAERRDAQTAGDGWTCFGNSGLGTGPGAQLTDASWLGAWAPGGGERTYGGDLGSPLPKGSRIVVQIHYNLLAGKQPDQSSVVLRESGPRQQVQALRTVLLPAPVELPCRPENAGPLCDRAAAVADVKKRFGAGPGSTGDLLHFLCGPVKAGIEQTCDRQFAQPMTIRAVAGHEHLLGTSIKIEVDPGGPRQRTVLDIASWDFDNQGATSIAPVRLAAGENVRVTCHHNQRLRDQQPAFASQRKDRYIVWGEGSTDEMCLGMLLVTDD